MENQTADQDSEQPQKALHTTYEGIPPKTQSLLAAAARQPLTMKILS